MSRMAKTVKVEIFNQTYSLRSEDGDLARTQALANKVDRVMREIADEAATADTLKIAILAALTLADELQQSNERYAQLNQQVGLRSAECVEILDIALKSR